MEVLQTAAVASSSRSYYGDSLETALLAWAAETIPEDLFGRFEQQVSYVVENVQKGIDGLTVSTVSLIGDYELIWDSSFAHADQADFRRWVYTLTNKPVEKRFVASGEWKLELHAEGNKPKTKTRKVYNVSEGQMAFNF